MVRSEIDRKELAGRLIALPGNDPPSAMKALLRQQKAAWPRLREGYAGLDAVESRSMTFGDVTIRIEFNPARIVSSSAPVDDRSVRERPCFLCAANLPPEQRGFLYGESHIMLCNPFPIFREHFTIPHLDHTPQRIDDMFGILLDCARDCASGYTVLYNGPRSGASAPDHQHFQAGEKGFLEIEREYEGLIGNGAPLTVRGAARVHAVDDGLRRWIAIGGAVKEEIAAAFSDVVRALAPETPGTGEPMMNIIAGCTGGVWTVLVFPRVRHRPSFYFAEGDARMLISPAGTDCGGVCVTPVEKDFRRLTPENIRTMFGEIMMSPGAFGNVCARIARAPSARAAGAPPAQ